MEKMLRYCQENLNISLSANQIEAFELYRKELILWNKKSNLTAITSPEEIEIKHFLDSLTCLHAIIAAKPISLIDVGTGAGFPGIPLKIVLPEIHLTLTDSIGKKIEFCQYLINLLILDHVTILNNRAEELGQDENHREKYDYAIARAVASLPILTEYLLPLVKVGGYTIAQKGKNLKEELQMAHKSIEILGGELQEIISVQLPGLGEERCLIILKKVRPTPIRYPRRPGVPAKNPLI